jgi:hypothetical protein
MNPLDDPNVIDGQFPLAAKTQYINPGTGPDRGKENRKRRRGAGRRRLIGRDGEGAKMRVHARAAGEVNYHFHFLI